MSEDSAEETPKFHPATFWLIAAMLLGGVVVGVVYQQRTNAKQRAWWASTHGTGAPAAPQRLSKLENDFEAVNRDGQSVRLSQMRGKVYLASYMFTTCPMGCSGNALKLKGVYDEFGDDDRFRLVTFSVDPEGDTPEKSDEFLNRFGVGADKWWYLTDSTDAMTEYVRKSFMLPAPKKSDDPAIKIVHSFAIALVDHKANVRGYYNLLHPQAEVAEGNLRRLKQDLRYILDNEMEPALPAPAEEKETNSK